MKRALMSFACILGMAGLSIPVYAQAWPTACGKDDVQYSVKSKKVEFTAPAAAPGAATVVFIEDLDGSFSPGPIVRFAVDGAWVGAARGKSYFITTVPAGKHELCASRQAKVSMDKENRGVVSGTFEAGKTYYFALNITRTEGDVERSGAGGANALGVKPDMNVRNAEYTDKANFAMLSEDKARELIKRSALSTSTSK